eukprot:TRINITY_DN1473_c1_g1_i1.p2 TRINITY_DN1473_c1_g1~~TRINITY_DN1473_c1_g1_i1.p2  ORF type:complete len:121 (+),score=27.33 TRINITY_DN1473_c1_g1_i1:44-406(+)
MLRRSVARFCQMVNVEFRTPDHEIIKARAKVGTSLMEAGKGAGVDIEAACDGACACSTCHCYVEPEWLAKLPKPTEDEEDMLDMAMDLRDNSRLACQIILSTDLEGMIVEMPKEVTSQLS